MKLFTPDQADQLGLVTAFLTARINDDEDAAIQLVTDKNGFKPEVVIDLLLAMTDFALAHVRLIAELAGTSPEEFLQTMGLTTEKYTAR